MTELGEKIAYTVMLIDLLLVNLGSIKKIRTKGEKTKFTHSYGRVHGITQIQVLLKAILMIYKEQKKR